MTDILEMLTHERDKLNRAIEALGGEIGGALGLVARVVNEVRKKPTMSAAARARISAAQKARWATVKGTSAKMVPAKAAPRKKYTLSAAARANIAAGARKRWARIKAGK